MTAARTSGRTLAAALALAAWVVPAEPARGEILEQVGGGDAVSLQAEQLEIDILSGQATLTGKVTLAKGDLTVSCPRVDLRFDHTPHLTWARGTGGVTADIRGVHAEAPFAELDLARQLLDLSGGVKLTRGQGWLAADRARIDVASGKATLTEVKGAVPVAKSP